MASTRFIAVFILMLCSLVAAALAAYYAATFATPAHENPISEGGKWINGAAVGLDWTDVQTSYGEVYGTKTGGSEPPYNDSIVGLAGTWGPNQTACATVYINSNQVQDSWGQEVELHLNFTIAAHSATGYEFNWHAVNDRSSYFAIVRWNGPLNNFTTIYDPSPHRDMKWGISTGDTICATSQNSVLSAYKNGVFLGSVTDTTYTNGSPGMGFDQSCGSTICNAYAGFTYFMATDGQHVESYRPVIDF